MSNVCAEGDRRVIAGRSRNLALQRAGELALEERFLQREKVKRSEKKRRKDSHLASAMANIERQKLKQEREVARICENDPTLRALKAKIQAGYMNKERKEQSEFTRKRAERVKQEDVKFYREAAENREGLLKQEKAKEEKRCAMRMQQREEIQAQLRRNENEARLRKIQEYQAEKAHADQIVADIQRQVYEENAAARNKMEQINKMMHEGVKLRAQELARRKREEEAQAKKIADHKERVAHRNDKRIALKKAQAEAKERIRLRIEADALAAQQKEETMQAALDVLRKEEREKREDQKERAKALRKHQDKMTMMNANEQQKEENRMRKVEEARLEAQIVARMKEKFRQDDLIAAAKLRKHKELEHDYKNEIHTQMQTRARFFANAKKADAEQQRKIREQEKYREEVVEAARKAILQEHAAKLKDYLPKGVFAKESDLQMLSVFDVDGDDVLSAAEASAAKKELLAYGDADGDGRLDAGERDRAFTRLRNAVDKDGDGRLSTGERGAARQLRTR